MLKENKDFKWSVIKDNFLSQDECDKLKEHLRNSKNKINRVYVTELDDKWLVDRAWMTFKLANTLHWKFDIDGFKDIVGLYYRKGEFTEDYALHSDFASSEDNTATFKLTGVLFLNDDFDGGELKILRGKVKPKPGRLVMYPAFAAHQVLKCNGDRFTIIFQVEGNCFV